MHIILGILIIAVSFALAVGTICAWLVGSVVGAYIYAFTFVAGILALCGMIYLGLKVMGAFG